MNKRIKELLMQSTNTVVGPLLSIEQETNYEKFAELIIKECLDLMLEEQKMYANVGTYESREYYERMAAKEDAFGDAASTIKYHFGVE